MSVSVFGLLLIVAGLGLWLYLAISRALDRHERMSAEWLERWHREHR